MHPSYGKAFPAQQLENELTGLRKELARSRRVLASAEEVLQALLRAAERRHARGYHIDREGIRLATENASVVRARVQKQARNLEVRSGE